MNTRIHTVWLSVVASAVVLAVWRIAAGGVSDVWWWVLLLWGAMWTGLIFQPLIKSAFPGMNHDMVRQDPARHLKDHEALMGYYPVVALVVGASSFVLSPMLFGTGMGALFLLHDATIFFAAALVSGVLNVGIFYFFNKALRYGDMSLVSAAQGLNPVFSIPLSFIFFAWLGSAYVSNPSVTAIGLAGIVVITLAVVVNGLLQKKRIAEAAPAEDWFAQHPLTSALASAVFAGVAVNVDKIAIDAGNPFLAGVVTMGTVALVTAAWTAWQSGSARVWYVFSAYRRAFLVVGVAYAVVIIVMNVTLYGHNVNYYAAIKRSSAVFGTVYGLYVLKEAYGMGNMALRLLTSAAIVAGTFLILFRG